MKTLSFAHALNLTGFVVAASAAAVLDKRAVSGTAVVDLSQSTGASKHLASGFIYGIPDSQGQIPDHFYADVGFSWARSGGAQLPGNGWMDSLAAYQVLRSSSSQHLTTEPISNAKIFETRHASSRLLVTTRLPGSMARRSTY